LPSRPRLFDNISRLISLLIFPSNIAPVVRSFAPLLDDSLSLLFTLWQHTSFSVVVFIAPFFLSLISQSCVCVLLLSESVPMYPQLCYVPLILIFLSTFCVRV
jgi:hypothetical protein